MTNLDFETWKSEYQPRVYEDSGAECFDHDECECEFLYTWTADELQEEDDEEWANAIDQNRVWTWEDRIYSGITNPRGDLIVTRKPWTEETVVS